MYEYICYCNKVTKGDIVMAMMNKAKTFEEVLEITKAMTTPNCKNLNPTGKSCKEDILELMKIYR